MSATQANDSLGVDTDVTEGAHQWTMLNGAINHATVLRAFDRARRDVATRLLGHHGVFVGYDSLLLAPATQGSDSVGSVLITASVLTRTGNHHTVEYVARAWPGAAGPPPATPPPLDESIIACGIGRTLHCEPATRSWPSRLEHQKVEGPA